MKTLKEKIEYVYKQEIEKYFLKNIWKVRTIEEMIDKSKYTTLYFNSSKIP